MKKIELKKLDADNVWLQNYISNVTCLVDKLKKRFRIMTREDEIINAAYNEAEVERQLKMHPQVFEQGFVAGAKWADRTMIEKACDWLEKKACLYVWKNCEQGEHGIHKTMLEDFRKAMEGGEK